MPVPKRGEPTPHEVKQRVRKDVRHPDVSPFQEAITSFPKNREYADGEQVVLANSDTRDRYTFRRTSQNQQDGGEWLMEKRMYYEKIYDAAVPNGSTIYTFTHPFADIPIIKIYEKSGALYQDIATVTVATVSTTGFSATNAGAAVDLLYIAIAPVSDITADW